MNNVIYWKSKTINMKTSQIEKENDNLSPAQKRRIYMEKTYPGLSRFTTPVKRPVRPVLGREKEMESVLYTFERPETCNVLLLAEAGTGKTALVQGLSAKDARRLYREVNLTRMIFESSQNANVMAALLQQLFEEAERYCQKEQRQLVLFFDEFHQLIRLSLAAAEAIKPVLADSGTRGLRILAATTFQEFDECIAPNQPLVERLHRISLRQPDREMTIRILQEMAVRYGVEDEIFQEGLLEDIVTTTDQYIPAASQPRKSINIFDSMIGAHRASGADLNADLLARVMKDSTGATIHFQVDAGHIKEQLDAHVFDQPLALAIIEGKLQTCVARFNDPNKPMASFLFAGSTGVGKTEMALQLARILFADARALIRFDMTEYVQPDSADRFRKELASRIWERPFSVVLLDEAEKACPEVLKMLYQILDAGRLSDRHNRTISFTNCYVILTVNSGSELFKTVGRYDSEGFLEPGQKGKTGTFNMEKYTGLLRDVIVQTSGGKFTPEFLGRIDRLVAFSPLSESTRKKITAARLEKLAQLALMRHNVRVYWQSESGSPSENNKICRWIVEDLAASDTDAGGARNIQSLIDRKISEEISRYINTHPNVDAINVRVQGELAIDQKHMLHSDAHVVVEPASLKR